MAERRSFNGSERTALYLAADGRCQCVGCGACGAGFCTALLDPGWHADHERPWSRGGETDITNGQALCPPCNRAKGSRVLREWQQNAKSKFHAAGKRDFLVSATPGAGKTTFALDLARDLVAAGQVDRIVVVVPSDNLRMQWADQGDAFGLPLVPVDEAADYDKDGYKGCVITYQQLRFGAELVRRATRTRTLAILDEIHHAGEQKAWGDALSVAMEKAVFRLALTGTPWRRDKRYPIPFVTYGDDDKIEVDYAYEYGEAVADGVCRSVEFHAYDGSANWKDPMLAEPLVSCELTKLNKNDVGIALDTVFDPQSPWISTLLAKGVTALDAMRLEVPDAGGLVVADNAKLARAYAKDLRSLTGEEPALALYDVPESKDVIKDFRRGGPRWIVAVRMVSEGVDIPRLGVGIYATKARTPLLFRQITGRFVRTRSDNDPNSLIFMPAVEEFVSLAREIEEELRHQLETETERERSRDQQPPLEFREGLSASAASFDRAILKGDDLSPEELAAAEAICQRFGFRPSEVAAMARMRRAEALSNPAPPQAYAPVSAPDGQRHRQERLLRGAVKTLANRVAYKCKVEPRQVNADLLNAGFPPRAKATVEDLRAMEQMLLKWLANAG